MGRGAYRAGRKLAEGGGHTHPDNDCVALALCESGSQAGAEVIRQRVAVDERNVAEGASLEECR